jgi:dihydroflavonol-4-reductase
MTSLLDWAVPTIPSTNDASVNNQQLQFMGRGIVVTGASGHLGFHIARESLARGWETRICIRSRNANVDELEKAGAKVVVCDLLDPSTYSAALRGVDCLFHVAAENTTSVSDRERVLHNTVRLTEVVLEAARLGGVPRIVYTSSVVVIGRSPDPAQLLDEATPVLKADQPGGFESPYVEGKVLAEEVCERFISEHGMDIRRTYPSWLLGPADLRGTPPQRTVADFVAKGQRLWVEGGISIASVIEVARAHLAVCELGCVNGRYVLAGENLTFRQFFGLLAEQAMRKPPAWKLPKLALLAAASVASPMFRMLGMEFAVTPGYVRAIVGRYSWYSSAKAERELGYNRVPAAELLAAAVVDARRRNLGVIELGRTRIDSMPQQASGLPLLITGVPGWLGNRMVDILINGDRLGRFATTRPVRLLVEPRFRGLLQLPSNYEIVYGDICDAAAVRLAVQGVSAVFHLAGAIYPPRTNILYRVNSEGTRTLVDACVEAGVRRVIYMGTDSICGRGTRQQRVFDEATPATPYRHYGRSKFMGEAYLLARTAEGKIDGTSLRGFWFFGPFAPERQKGFVRMFFWPRQLVFGNGKNLRSISHVDDIVAAFLQAETSSATIGKWYWICDPLPHSVDAIYAAVAQAMKVAYRPVHLPVPVCACFNLLDRVMGRAGRLHPTIHAAGKFYFDIAGDISAARRDFGFDPKMHLADAAQELACGFSDKRPNP